MPPTVLKLDPIATLDNEAQFLKLCEANPHLRLERDAQGALVVMPPTGGEGSRWEGLVFLQLGKWNEQTDAGVAFPSTAMFRLPSGPWRCPDAAWIPRARWEALRPEERRGFLPLAPDFVIEVRSPSDGRHDVEVRIGEWVAAGVRLAWFLDPVEETATIYWPGQPPRVLPLSGELRGDPLLPGFVFRWHA